MSPDEIEKTHNIVSEVSVAPNGYKHRFDPNKRDGDFPLEQPEWTKDPRWQGWNGEDPEWIMKQQKKYPYGGESKQSVRVSEAQLHQIVKESIEQILNEAYSDAQYAHLAGQASGALNGFGGKIKGLFNPKWKARKERQMRKFANQATGDGYTYGNSSTKGGDNNYGRNTVNMSGNDYTYEHGGTRDYLENNFNAKNKENPFEMQRSQRYVEPKFNGSSKPLSHNGEVYSRKDVRDMRDYYGQNNQNYDHDKFNEFNDVMHGNGQLNRAFQQGQEARKGYAYKTLGGTYTNGTGTSSGAFKRLK